MALDTYNNLKLAIADWMHRGDLTAPIVDCITLAEARIKSLLWTRDQEISASLTTTGGVQFVNLPADFLHARSVSIPDHSPSVTYITPDDYARLYYSGYTGVPRNYTLIDGQMYFGPVPDAAYSVLMAYKAAFVPLSNTVQTNALLAKWPNLYLWGSLVEAASYSEDDAKQAKYEAKFRDALPPINVTEANGPGLMTVTTDARNC